MACPWEGRTGLGWGAGVLIPPTTTTCTHVRELQTIELKYGAILMQFFHKWKMCIMEKIHMDFTLQTLKGWALQCSRLNHSLEHLILLDPM